MFHIHICNNHASLILFSFNKIISWIIKKKERNELPQWKTLNLNTILYIPRSFHCCSLFDELFVIELLLMELFLVGFVQLHNLQELNSAFVM